MDTIRFEINKKANKQYRKFYDIVLFLNDKQVPHNIFNIASVLGAYSFNGVELYTFTCECGEPGCAGFFSTVKQFRSNSNVRWIFPSTEEYKVDKLEYVFDIEQFDLQLSMLKYRVVRLANKGRTPLAHIECCEKYNLIGEINLYKKIFRRASNSYENLKLNFPEYINNTYYYKYEEQISWEYNFQDLVYILIGEQPEYVEEGFNTFLVLCRVGARAIVQFLSDDKLVFNSIFENKNLSDLCYKLNDVDNFDLTKLELVQK
jgi:hypothetical protein